MDRDGAAPRPGVKLWPGMGSTLLVANGLTESPKYHIMVVVIQVTTVMENSGTRGNNTASHRRGKAHFQVMSCVPFRSNVGRRGIRVKPS